MLVINETHNMSNKHEYKVPEGTRISEIIGKDMDTFIVTLDGILYFNDFQI